MTDQSSSPGDTSHPDHKASRMPVARTRTGAAWVGVAVGVVVVVLLIIFTVQNPTPVDVQFLGLHGTAPLGAMLLLSGVAFAVLTLIIGSLRIGQLRRRIGRGDPRSDAES